MSDVAAIADKMEIIGVCTRLHWCYDHQDWDGFDALFTDVVSMPTLAEAASPGFDAGRYLDSYLFAREELKRALSSVQHGLITQHLIAGHQVTLDGDRAVCLAHSINAHLADRAAPASAGGGLVGGLVAHGNDYRFDLVRTADGWRIRGWVPCIRWGCGDEASYDAAAKQATWRQG
jgi:SnoaL-like domain